MRAELKEIKTALSANLNPQLHRNDNLNRNEGGQRGQGGGYRRYRRKCDDCNKRNAFRCFHCFLCGSAEHRMNCCPTKDDQKN